MFGKPFIHVRYSPRCKKSAKLRNLFQAYTNHFVFWGKVEQLKDECAN
jgi:hypothetical protein